MEDDRVCVPSRRDPNSVSVPTESPQGDTSSWDASPINAADPEDTPMTDADDGADLLVPPSPKKRRIVLAISANGYSNLDRCELGSGPTGIPRCRRRRRRRDRLRPRRPRLVTDQTEDGRLVFAGYTILRMGEMVVKLIKPFDAEATYKFEYGISGSKKSPTKGPETARLAHRCDASLGVWRGKQQQRDVHKHRAGSWLFFIPSPFLPPRHPVQTPAGDNTAENNRIIHHTPETRQGDMPSRDASPIHAADLVDTPMTDAGDDDEGTIIAEDVLPNPGDSPWQPKDQDVLCHYMGQVIEGWANVTSLAIWKLFDGKDDYLDILATQCLTAS
ncbi:hypothetical protein C8A03DRAFT_32376 [Achaetomium macrosporum]|uniref:Uncharacterized protein n=1 Tax=Achaetomium macrosporum TaxID=79813 RepID=A0AAN7CCM5_9PEZI|nr:hypothetical protein C8A03DRAFT_32376 [Achaetomium macrosporum]